MFKLGADIKVYLRREPIDFRAGINSRAVLVQETMALDPFAPAVFVFFRRHDRMKLLFFLTEDWFRWPRREAAVVTLSTEPSSGATGYFAKFSASGQFRKIATASFAASLPTECPRLK